MAIDTIAGTTGVGLQIQDPTTHTLAVSGITTGGTTSATATGMGLQIQDPTAYSYGTSIGAVCLAAVPIIFTGAAVIGVGLLAYAITKAALDPKA